MADLKLSELLGIAPLIVLIVFLGIYPQPVLDRISPAVDRLIEHVDSRVDDYDEQEPVLTDRTGADGLIAVAEKIHAEAEEGHSEDEDHSEEESRSGSEAESSEEDSE